MKKKEIDRRPFLKIASDSIESSILDKASSLIYL